MRSRLVLFVSFIVLGLAVLVICWPRNRSIDLGMGDQIVHGLPGAIPGWTVRDSPIADTPEMKRAVDEMLNYDKAVFRTYSNGRVSFSVYVAYWSPGRFHPRLISIHTPDVCWLGNGMKIAEADYNRVLSVKGDVFWHAQYREFILNNQKTYVVYWHILNGALSGYAEEPNSQNRSFLKNMWRDMVDGVGEQYFIRISSDNSMDKLMSEPIFLDILSHFSPVLTSNFNGRH